MKSKIVIYITFLVFGSQALLAQDKLRNAVYKLKKGELDQAKELIDAASEDPRFMDRAATWYYKGFIYKDFFKRDEADDKHSPMREQAVEFYKKSYEIDSAGTYAKSVANGLKHLAQTYYNHSATSFNPETYTEALTNYEKYKATLRIIQPDADFAEKDINFKLALASTYGRVATEDSANNVTYLAKAKELYEQVISLDSNNVSAHYNLGILYYNEGVEIINNMSYDSDLFELEMRQGEMIQKFKISLPHMKKAYDLNPLRKEVLEGLQGIYFSLNDMAKSQAYKKELESLDNVPVESPKEVEQPKE